MANQVFDKEVIEQAVIETAKDFFKLMPNPPLTNDPVVNECDVIEYKGRLRVTGVEKFHMPCHIAAVSFFTSAENKEKDTHACGTLFICTKEDLTSRILSGVGQKDFDEDNPEELLGACGDFCAKFAEKLLARLSRSGYGSLVFSDAIMHKNSLPSGINFPFKQYYYLEVQFEMWRQMCLVFGVMFDPSAK